MGLGLVGVSHRFQQYMTNLLLSLKAGSGTKAIGVTVSMSQV